MTTQKKKKSAKEKRVLIGSVAVAAAIVAGSTFAWFSSKDEVTNRLTASADYNVSIVEDFQPPMDWIPGQTINKDVSAVNTGNVDAFVRMWLDGKLRLLNETAAENEPSATAAVTTVLPTTGEFGKVTDPNRTKLGLNYYNKNGNNITYYKTLSTKKIENPLDENHGTAGENATQEANHDPAAFSEVQSMQAAGVLAYAPTDAAYTWKLEQAADLWVLDNGVAKLTTVAKDTVVGSVNSSATVKVCAAKNDTTGNYYGSIDASTFQPETTGLYLFRRNIEDTDDGTANGYEYSGYYFVKKGSTGAPTALADDNTYFALHTDLGDNKHSDYVVPADSVSETTNTNVPTADQELPAIISTTNPVRVFTASETVIDDTGLTWAYDATNKKFVVSTGTDPKDIVIDIQLANIGSNPEEWTAKTPASTPIDNRTTFYYNNDLEAGDTTTKLVDSVTLSSDTEVGAYLAFDFDLNVYLDSVQVTMDEEGNESDTTVSGGWGVDNLTDDSGNGYYDHASNITAATGSKTVTDGEISKMTWN